MTAEVEKSKADLLRLTQEEDYKRQLYTQHRHGLQDIWDNLVQLSTHIAMFHAKIQKITEEETGAQPMVKYTDHLIPPADIFKLQHLIQTKKALQSELASHEAHSKQLKRTIEKKLINLYLPVKGTDDRLELTQPLKLTDDQLAAARTEVTLLSRQLKADEAEGARLTEQLAAIENEIVASTALQEVNSDAVKNPQEGAHSLNRLLIDSTAPKEGDLLLAPSLSSARSDTPSRNSNWRVEGGVSIVDVLSGRADVARLEGERPAAYKARLLRRLANLRYLEGQLRQELEEKAALPFTANINYSAVSSTAPRVPLSASTPLNQHKYGAAYAVAELLLPPTPFSGPTDTVSGASSRESSSRSLKPGALDSDGSDLLLRLGLHHDSPERDPPRWRQELQQDRAIEMLAAQLSLDLYGLARDPGAGSGSSSTSSDTATTTITSREPEEAHESDGAKKMLRHTSQSQLRLLHLTSSLSDALQPQPLTDDADSDSYSPTDLRDGDGESDTSSATQVQAVNDREAIGTDRRPCRGSYERLLQDDSVALATLTHTHLRDLVTPRPGDYGFTPAWRRESTTGCAAGGGPRSLSPARKAATPIQRRRVSAGGSSTSTSPTLDSSPQRYHPPVVHPEPSPHHQRPLDRRGSSGSAERSPLKSRVPRGSSSASARRNMGGYSTPQRFSLTPSEDPNSLTLPAEQVQSLVDRLVRAASSLEQCHSDFYAQHSALFRSARTSRRESRTEGLETRLAPIDSDTKAFEDEMQSQPVGRSDISARKSLRFREAQPAQHATTARRADSQEPAALSTKAATRGIISQSASQRSQEHKKSSAPSVTPSPPLPPPSQRLVGRPPPVSRVPSVTDSLVLAHHPGARHLRAATAPTPCNPLEDLPPLSYDLLEGRDSDGGRVDDRVVERSRAHPMTGGTAAAAASLRSQSSAAISESAMAEKIAVLEARLERVEASAAAARKLVGTDPLTGAAVDPRTGHTLASLEVTVCRAVNLPEAKRVSHTTDAYVALHLLRGETEGEEDQQETGLIYVARTATQWASVHPEWHEYFVVPGVRPADLALRLRTLHCTRLGAARDTPLGDAYLSLEALTDGLRHKFWLPLLLPPEESHRRARLPSNCSLLVEAQLFGSPADKLDRQADLIRSQIRQLQRGGSVGNSTSSSLKGLQRTSSSAKSYTMDESLDISSAMGRSKVNARQIIGLRERRTVKSFLRSAAVAGSSDLSARTGMEGMPSYYLSLNRLETRSSDGIKDMHTSQSSIKRQK